MSPTKAAATKAGAKKAPAKKTSGAKKPPSGPPPAVVTSVHPLGEISARRRWTDRIMRAVVYGAFAAAMVPLVWLSWTVIEKGIDRFFLDSNGENNFNLDFFTDTQRGVFGGMPEGGIYHAIVGTLMMTLAAALISIPIGLLTAIYLVEYGRGWLARAVTFFVDVMTGIPSIVAGLFAYALFQFLFGGPTKTGIVGAVALSVLMIPVVVRASEEMLRLVPNELREASYALGVPKWLTIIKVVIRTSFAGITTGVMLAIARVIGETAPLLIAVGFIDSYNINLFDGKMASLPVYIVGEWRKGDQPCPEGTPIVGCTPEITEYRAWAAALTLIVIVMLLNLIARMIAKYLSPKTSR